MFNFGAPRRTRTVRRTTRVGFQQHVRRTDTPHGRTLRLESLERRCLLAVTPGGSDPGSNCCSQGDVIYYEDFESGDGNYTADNTGGTYTGLWHYSIGRRDDGLPNHSRTHSWYYGAFETSTGGGEYYIGRNHQGTLTSPTLPTIPECGRTALCFNYLLDTRDQLDRDFVEVRIVEVVNEVEVNETTIFSRAGTGDENLPETGNAWYTACYEVTAYAGQDVRVRFFFDTGDPPELDPEGWYVDDVRLVNVCLPATITDSYKFNDLDADGLAREEGEPGLEGWTIFVDYDNDNILDDDEPFTVTDEDGGYTITDITPGTWPVREVLQPGWTNSFPEEGSYLVTFESGRNPDRPRLRQLDHRHDHRQLQVQ